MVTAKHILYIWQWRNHTLFLDINSLYVMRCLLQEGTNIHNSQSIYEVYKAVPFRPHPQHVSGNSHLLWVPNTTEVQSFEYRILSSSPQAKNDTWRIWCCDARMFTDQMAWRVLSWWMSYYCFSNVSTTIKQHCRNNKEIMKSKGEKRFEDHIRFCCSMNSIYITPALSLNLTKQFDLLSIELVNPGQSRARSVSLDR